MAAAAAELHLDFETFSEVSLKDAGLDRYSRAAEVLLCAWTFDRGAWPRPPRIWQRGDGPFPAELRDALLDPHVEKWGFNNQFERTIARRALRIATPVEGWRCAMALAYMQGFSGDLEDVGQQVGLPADKAKLKDGKRLVRKFCGPQKVTKNQPHRVRDQSTDPEDWGLFRAYCGQDVVAEHGIKRRLLPFPVPPSEWRLYELDQIINDRGLPIDLAFVEQAVAMAERRTAELVEEMRAISGVRNPNSTVQLVPWLRARGYPFIDLQKDTVSKVLNEDREKPVLTDDARAVLRLRQWAARISTRKFNAVRAAEHGGRIRFTLQFHGASRTGRWAGRRLQGQNMPRTPACLEAHKGLPPEAMLRQVTDLIREGDYDGVRLYVAEPMEAIVGCTRSMIATGRSSGKRLVVSDLAAIESRVLGWLSGCERLLQVFFRGLDPYKDFATGFYRVAYGDVTKAQRTICKPPVLGAGYRLGGGELREGKRTGLWGYAESMGIDMPREEAHRAVRVFRDTYVEVVQFWYDLENAAQRCVLRGARAEVGSFLAFEWLKPYLTVVLPSGRRLFYHLPRLERMRFQSPRTGEPYERVVLTHMGQEQKTGRWKRLPTHGGKLTENIVQAVARDILAHGMVAAHEAGFSLCGHVHDELIAEEAEGSNARTLERLRDLMRAPVPWAPGLPLDAAGYEADFYRKD